MRLQAVTESTEQPADGGQPAGLALTETLLEAALQAQRNGSFDELVRGRPRLARWLMRHHARLMRGTAAAAAGGSEAAAVAAGAGEAPRQAALLLRWLCTQLRPDAGPGFEGIDERAWLDLSSWRPMLAMACHAGFLQAPDFPRRYRRRSGEAALDNLCGLWDVGASTVYRILERARRAMALVLLDASPNAARSLSLRRFVLLDVQQRLGLAPGPALQAWHRQQTDWARRHGDPAAELWHGWQAEEPQQVVQTLRQQASALAVLPETEAIVVRIAPQLPTPRLQVDLWLARAALARTRSAAERELQAYEHARAVAQAAQDPVLLGIVYSELGKYHEPRDADRAFACYQDSAEFLRDLNPAGADQQALAQYLLTLARLAWMYALRNDERSRALLDRAESLRPHVAAASDVIGMLEQVWAEYWRRAGKADLSLEHRYRALNIFERVGDRRSVLATTLNLVMVHGERGDLPRALQYARRIFEAARAGTVEPALLVSTHGNLGLAHFLTGDLGAAIEQYRLALDRSLAAGLRLHAFRTRYNLAEAHYTRLQQQGDAADEAAGDGYIREALAAPESDSNPAAIEAARALKAKILGIAKANAKAAEPNRMLPGEDAVHLAEMSEVHRHREVLAVPGEATQHAQAHLAIARAYLAISTKEREAALALIHKHGLQAQFSAEFEELKQTFQRELTREQHLADAWKRAAADVVDDARRAPLIAHLVREGSINKSGYVELCAVSPATASKHLGQLLERGLLVQLGKGPSTRYELPA
jgi:tetratricopeptide (TPR) repeat protein